MSNSITTCFKGERKQGNLLVGESSFEDLLSLMIEAQFGQRGRKWPTHLRGHLCPYP